MQKKELLYVQDGCEHPFKHTKGVSLVVTHKCNLNCVYCYEKHKSDKEMSFETAKNILLIEFSAREKGVHDTLRIEFFGGEPFMNFELIKKIVAWVKSEERSMKYYFFATTNGTLLTEEVKNWIRANRDFIIGMSFDGTPEMQNVNRNQSARRVALDFFKEVNPDQFLKMTVSPYTLPYFYEGVRYLHENGFYFTANCAYGCEWEDSDLVELERQLMLLADYYLLHPEFNPIALLALGIREIRVNGTPRLACGMGQNMIAYDVDGIAYPCVVVTSVSRGDTKGHKLLHKNFSNPEEYFDERCSQCILRMICSTCYAANFNNQGDIRCREKMLCKLYIVCAKVYCYFKIEQIKMKKSRQEQLDWDDIQEAAGIAYAFEHGFPDSAGMRETF